MLKNMARNRATVRVLFLPNDGLSIIYRAKMTEGISPKIAIK